MHVLGIDPGYVNFSYCEIDSENAHVARTWVVERIVHPRVEANEDTVFAATYQWCIDHLELLERVDRIVIEKQRRPIFKIMVAVIRTLWVNKVVLVHPFTLCSVFKLPRTRDAKKRATITFVAEYMLTPFPDHHKEDDLADSCMLALWLIFQNRSSDPRDPGDLNEK